MRVSRYILSLTSLTLFSIVSSPAHSEFETIYNKDNWIIASDNSGENEDGYSCWIITGTSSAKFGVLAHVTKDKTDLNWSVGVLKNGWDTNTKIRTQFSLDFTETSLPVIFFDAFGSDSIEEKTYDGKNVKVGYIYSNYEDSNEAYEIFFSMLRNEASFAIRFNGNEPSWRVKLNGSTWAVDTFMDCVEKLERMIYSEDMFVETVEEARSSQPFSEIKKPYVKRPVSLLYRTDLRNKATFGMKDLFVWHEGRNFIIGDPTIENQYGKVPQTVPKVGETGMSADERFGIK